MKNKNKCFPALNCPAISIAVIISFLILNTASGLNANPYRFQKWQVAELEFKADIKSGNPFGLRFGAVFTSNAGKKMDIPGYYNGGNSWVIRFCPPEEGTWFYETYSTEKKLTGQKGAIDVIPNENKNEHGAIVISKNNRQKFEYEDGTPYFLMAFELDWLFAIDAENDADIPKTREMISHLSKNGFNQVVMNVYAYDAGWGNHKEVKPEHNFAKPIVFPFGGTNDKPDFSTLNLDFFKHLDRVIAHLQREGIVAHLMIYVWNKKVNWPGPESEADNNYFDYVVKRYQAFPNLIWDISKEALDYGHDDMGYITRRIDRLRKLDGHNRLLSVHDYRYCENFPGKVDFISIQSWVPDIYNKMKTIGSTYQLQPVFNIEHGGYEKTMHSHFDVGYTNPVVCLERNYQCAFAGVYSTYYWQNTSWFEVVYNPDSLPEEKQPGFAWYKYLKQLFTDYNFNDLSIYHSGANAFGLSDHKKNYLFYLPRDLNALTGQIPGLMGQTVAVKWFDPLTGTYHNGGEKQLKSSWVSIKKTEGITSPFCIAILEVIK